MRARLPPLLAYAVSFLLVLPSCKNAEQQKQVEDNAHKLTAESTTDATAPIVDDNYKFRLGWPGEGWKLMGPADAGAILQGACAGAVAPSEGLTLVVIVESMPGASLDAFADLVLGNTQSMVTDPHVESREALVFAGEPAVRVTWTDKWEGSPRRWIDTFFVHDGHGYRLLGSGPPAKVSERAFAPLYAEFSLLEGKVSGPPVVASPDRDGPGWRLHDGVFESAVSGIRVAPPAGWRFTDFGQLGVNNPDAEVGLEAPGVGAYVVLTPTRIRKHAAANYWQSRLEQAEGYIDGKRDGDWTATMFGAPTKLAVFASPPLEHSLGTHVVGEHGIEAFVSYPAASRDVARAEVTAVLAAITTLDPGRRAAVRSALESASDQQARVGSRHALRGGVLHDFDAAVRWTKPPGFWTLRAVDDAATDEVEKLQFTSLENGLSGILVSERLPSRDAATYHRDSVMRFGGVAGPKRAMPTASGTVDVTTVGTEVGGQLFRTDVGTIVHDGWAVRLEVFGEPELMDAAENEIAAIFAGLEQAEEIPMTRLVDGEYVDARFGFAIYLGSDWTYEDITPPHRTTLTANLDLSYKGGGGVSLIVLGATDKNPEFIRSVATQPLRESLTKEISEATEGATTLARAPALRTTWSGKSKRAEMISAVIGGSVFVLVAEGVAEDDFAKLAQTFRVLK